MRVDVNIDGRLVNFGLHGTGTEYEIGSLETQGLRVSSCMKELRAYTKSHFPDAEGPIDLAVRLGADKGSWEQAVLGIYISETEDTSFVINFMINAAIGMQQPVVREVVNSSIRGSAFTLRSVEHDSEEFPIIEADGWRGWDIDLSIEVKSALLFDDLLRVRSRISQEIFLPREALTTPFLLLSTLQMGNAFALIGRTESEWLEVKSHAYDMRNADESRWKLELALDVSQFANSAEGGLLLIGFRTKRVNGVDTIDRITAAPRNPTRLQTYRDVLKHRIHPPINGLQVGSIPWDNADIIYVYIPAQEDENKPYLVNGAIIDDCYITSGVSIVRRQGDTCTPVTAQEIHAALAIGRAVMRNQQ